MANITWLVDDVENYVISSNVSLLIAWYQTLRNIQLVDFNQCASFPIGWCQTLRDWQLVDLSNCRQVIERLSAASRNEASCLFHHHHHHNIVKGIYHIRLYFIFYFGVRNISLSMAKYCPFDGNSRYWPPSEVDKLVWGWVRVAVHATTWPGCVTRDPLPFVS